MRGDVCNMYVIAKLLTYILPLLSGPILKYIISITLCARNVSLIAIQFTRKKRNALKATLATQSTRQLT